MNRLQLSTVERYITEAQEEHRRIEIKALDLAHDVLQEKWNDAAKILIEAGGKLYAASSMINRDPVSLLKLEVPRQGQNFGSWKWPDLVDRSSQYSLKDLLSI
ncbi:hypothetical protein ACCD10_24240 [Pseudomonas sp. Pseusp122]|uniref:hypothetical protein n=1 Tax=unclassified Pseudomonas TaxID=196821 RepID=UPI0039A5A039